MNKLAAFAARGDEPIAGTVAVGDGESFNVGEALEDGGGTIVVVSGSKLEHSLNGYDGLESVSVPDGAEAINAEEAEPTAPKASKAVKKKADELNVDLTEVEGTGSKGAIKVEDVEKRALELADAEASQGGAG